MRNFQDQLRASHRLIVNTINEYFPLVDREALGIAYSITFLRAVSFILPHEEEFARGHWGDEKFVVAENVSGDSGGCTKYGIDASSHPGVDIENLTRDQAISIYADEWHWRNLDALPERLAIALFDVWVNGGFPVKWLQIALNKVGNLTCPLVVDGDLGPKTIVSSKVCDQNAVLRYFFYERDSRFAAIATGPRAKFLAGWENRDRDLENYLRQLT